MRQKTWAMVLLLTGLLLFLGAGCQESATLASPVPTILADTSSSASTSPPPASPTSLPPTVSPTPRPTENPTRRPSATLIPPLTVSWQSFSTSGYDSAAVYSLARPVAQSLLAIYYGLSLYEQESDVPGIYWPWQDEDAFRRLLAHELSLYQPDELTAALSLVKNTSPLDGRDDKRLIIEAAFLAALNQSGSDLSDGGTVGVFAYTPVAADLDHDGLSEWIVRLVIHDDDEERFVVIDREVNGRFTTLPADEISLISGSPDYRIDHSHDLTGDGQPDLILIEEFESEVKIHAYTWNGVRLQALAFDPLFGSRQVLLLSGENAYEFDDFDNDDVVELKVQEQGGGVNLNWNFCDEPPYLLEWAGTTTIRTELESAIPLDLSCLTPPALFLEPQPIPQQSQLERIVNNLTPADWERHASWYALVHTKLAAVQWLAGETEAVQETMTAVWTADEDEEYVQFLQEFWDTAGGDFLVYCRTLHHNFWLEPGDGYTWTHYGDFVYHLGGRYNKVLGDIPIGEFICPSTSLTVQQLNETVILSSQTPQVVLAQVNVPVLRAELFNIDDDPEEEWVGVVDSGSYLLSLWDQVDGKWQWTQLATFNSNYDTAEIELLELAWRDVTGDGQADLLSLMQFSDHLFGAKTYQVLSVYDLNAGRLLLDAITDSVDLATVDQNQVEMFIAEQPIPYLFEPDYFQVAVAGKIATLGDHLDNLSRRLIDGEDPAIIRPILEETLRKVPPDEINAALAFRQLTYLIGYSYELEGRPTEAITTYRHLIEIAPDSYWSWLAYARLEPDG